MIDPKAALALINRHTAPLAKITVTLGDALGYVLAEDVRSPISLPAFDNSAMDGYAIRWRDVANSRSAEAVRLELRATVYAGDTAHHTLHAGEARGIMTGAPMPRGADAIIPVEEAVVDGSSLVVGGPVPPYRHVRRKGEEIRKGKRIVGRGATVHPGTIACLATVGRRSVAVFRKPAVSLITTGDETVEPGRPLKHGQIYDSNFFMIEAQLRAMGIEPVRTRRVGDRADALSRSVGAALGRSDVVIVVGGASVGDRDHLRNVLSGHRVRQIFWRVSQKPGKPLYFGVRGRRLVFGLPGNPASAFTCFYMYVYPALRCLAGHKDGSLARTTRRVKGVIADRTKWRFLKAVVHGDGSAAATGGQGSHMITSLAGANRIIVVPPGRARSRGHMMTYRLPYAEDDE